MKVLMTADTVGGVWTYSLQLAQALQTYGVEVSLATMGGALSEAQACEAACLPNLTLYRSGYKLEWMDDPWQDVAEAGEWLLCLEQRIEPDIVHLNGYTHAALPWRAPTLVVGHSCVLSWWRAVKGSDAPAEWSRYRREVERGLRAAGVVVAPSNAMLAALQRHYGPLDACRVVYNGLDYGHQGVSKRDVGEKEPFILSVGRLWDEAKNVAALGRVAPMLPWPVRTAGESKHPDGRRAVIEGVYPLGRLSQTNMRGWFSRASIYALPARYEPFGLSALEAGLAGCALVLGDIPSLREVWGDAALFVPPDDTAALQAALLELIADDGLRGEMGARAVQHALRYSAEAMAAGYMEAYAKLQEPALCAS